MRATLRLIQVNSKSWLVRKTGNKRPDISPNIDSFAFKSLWHNVCVQSLPCLFILFLQTSYRSKRCHVLKKEKKQNKTTPANWGRKMFSTGFKKKNLTFIYIAIKRIAAAAHLCAQRLLFFISIRIYIRYAFIKRASGPCRHFQESVHSLTVTLIWTTWPRMELELMANAVIWHPNTPNTFLHQLFSFMFCFLGFSFYFVRVNYFIFVKSRKQNQYTRPLSWIYTDGFVKILDNQQ